MRSLLFSNRSEDIVKLCSFTSQERQTRSDLGFSERVRRGCVVACKSRNVDVRQSARDLIYGRITSQRRAEMALRHSLFAKLELKLRKIYTSPPTGVNRCVPPGSLSNFRKKLTNDNPASCSKVDGRSVASESLTDKHAHLVQ